jgi:phosphoribosylformylglycinamidine cyclo-ligase
MGGLSYTRAGVDTTQVEHETDLLAKILAPTMKLRTGVGRSVLGHGYYASALRISDDMALACCTDGVGSKVLVAEQMGKFDTIGIDCVAMNVNDMICIGAEPLAMLDYIAVERLNPGLLAEVAKGLAEGARQARISIPGGETAQLPEIIRGVLPGRGLDLVGTAIGILPMKRLNDGGRVAPGDVVVGLKSTGVHSNGYTLARRALLEGGRYDVESHVGDLGTTVGEALLTPTRIYVAEAMELFEKLDVKALCHITGDGFLNLCRVAAPVGFVLDDLPPPPPIFDLIRRSGSVEIAEMYRVFNMGIGLCVTVAPKDVDRACEIARKHGSDPLVIGHAVADPTRTVKLAKLGLSGNTTTFS